MIVFLRPTDRDVVHVVAAVEGARRTHCGIRVPDWGWREAPLPTESGFESDLRRCNRPACRAAFAEEDARLVPFRAAIAMDVKALLAEAFGIDWSCQHGCAEGNHAAPDERGVCLCCGDLMICPMDGCSYAPSDDDDLAVHVGQTHRA